jgi:hypothetical protein
VSDLYIIRKAELAESYKLTENYDKWSQKWDYSDGAI